MLKYLIILLIIPTISIAESVDNTASVTIVEPITLVAYNDMDFGKVVKPISGNKTVVLTYTGNTSGTATRLSSTTSGGTVGIAGDSNNNTVDITISTTLVPIGLTLTNFTGIFGNRTVVNSRILNTSIPNGNALLRLGATLTVQPNATAGDHTLTYTVDVTYN